MKNAIFERLKSKVLIEIEGKNLERFIRRLVTNKIELLKVSYPKRNIAHILVYRKDYEKIEEIKTIYRIELLDSSGMIRLKKKWRQNQLLVFFMLMGLFLLLFLTNLIYTIEIVHTDAHLRTLLLKELDQYGIHEKSFKKSFKQIEAIKKQILEKHKDTIEWLEIENIGTKYIVRVEERKLPSEKPPFQQQHVTAKKSAIIKKVEAKSGVIVRNNNDYVKAGDVVISGEISLNETVKDYTQADGVVYGEVWYQMEVEYPLIYQEQKTTGKKNTVYTFQFLNHRFELFNFHPYKDKKIEGKRLWKSFVFPISLQKEKQSELDVIEEINTEEEAIKKAEALARQKMESQLNDNEHIISQKNLKVDLKKSTITLEVFFTVYEDITDYLKIEPINPGE